MTREEKLEALAKLLGKYSRKLMIVKRKDASVIESLTAEDLKDLAKKIKDDDYFHKHFKTRIAIRRGDVFRVSFNYECGSELSGSHFVVAINDSKVNEPMVTVVPLKSYKGKLNPRSDVLLGIVEGTKTGKESIAVINQIKGIDKSRMIEDVKSKTLEKIFNDTKIAEDDEIVIKVKTIYRLTAQQLYVLMTALNDYINFGYISHEI